jgi:hypothetical protein
MAGIVFARRQGAGRAVNARRAAQDEELEAIGGGGHLEQRDRRVDVKTRIVLRP